MSEDQNTLNSGLPENFWAVPEAFISEPTLQLLHSEVCSRLRQENPDADVLELMAIERVASLYIWMRSKEQTGGFGTDASYKDVIKLWTTMAADLRKTRISGLENADAQAQITDNVVGAVIDSLAGLDPEVANTVKRRVLERMGSL